MTAALPGEFRDLPPRWAHFCLDVERFMRLELGIDPVGANFLCAFSGGADSTALLLTLHALSLKNGGRVFAAHLDHGLRDRSADEAAHCREMCRTMDVGFVSQRQDVLAVAKKMNKGVEEAGRQARYDFLKAQAEQLNCEWIATGHHLGDLAEDVIMRLIRGAGWPGLSGMTALDDSRRLVRPLLLTKKETLTSFLQKLGIEWIEDESNRDPSMTRNRVRNAILPLFLEENPNFLESISRLWRLGNIDQDYWESKSKQGNGPLLAQETLERSHQALRLRLYKAVLDELGPGQALADTLLKMDEAWMNRKYGSIFQYPGDRTGKITPKGVLFGFKR